MPAREGKFCAKARVTAEMTQLILIAGKNPEDLSFQARLTGEYLLMDAIQEVSQRCVNESSIRSHLRDPRGEVVVMLISFVIHNASISCSAYRVPAVTILVRRGFD